MPSDTDNLYIFKIVQKEQSLREKMDFKPIIFLGTLNLTKEQLSKLTEELINLLKEKCGDESRFENYFQAQPKPGADFKNKTEILGQWILPFLNDELQCCIDEEELVAAKKKELLSHSDFIDFPRTIKFPLENQLKKQIISYYLVDKLWIILAYEKFKTLIERDLQQLGLSLEEELLLKEFKNSLAHFSFNGFGTDGAKENKLYPDTLEHIEKINEQLKTIYSIFCNHSEIDRNIIYVFHFFVHCLKQAINFIDKKISNRQGFIPVESYIKHKYPKCLEKLQILKQTVIVNCDFLLMKLPKLYQNRTQQQSDDDECSGQSTPPLPLFQYNKKIDEEIVAQLQSELKEKRKTKTNKPEPGGFFPYSIFGRITKQLRDPCGIEDMNLDIELK